MQPGDVKNISESYAIFGELTSILADGAVELTAGLRYFEDEIGVREISRFNNLSASLIRTDRTFDATSPRVVANWHFNDSNTIYASYAEGFRSGADQTPSVLSVAPGLPPAEPDNLKNYEIGAKGTVFSRALTYDLALYYMDWEDVQQTLTVVYGSALLPALTNGTEAAGFGFDVGMTARVFESVTLGLNYSENDLTQRADVVLPSGILSARKGDRLPFSAKQTIGGSANYQSSIGKGGYIVSLSASANYTSERPGQFLSGNVITELNGDDIFLVGLKGALISPAGWEATIFVDNVNNERGAVTRIFVLPEWTSRVRPRTVGVQLDYRF